MKRRNITFKPKTLLFGPLTHKPKEMIRLSDDELESLYLADFKGLYQEECAKQLGVSRPTFAKLIKNARKKMIEMLMYGRGIELLQEKKNYTLIYPTDDRVNIHPYFLIAKLFAFAQIEDDKIVSITYIDNPIYKDLEAKNVDICSDESAKGMAAGRIIPPLLKDGNILVVKSLGDGMRRNLEGIGLNIEFTELTDIDSVLESLD